MKIVEGLERDALLLQVARKPVASEDSIGGPRRAAVGVAVADVNDLAICGQVGALARLAARSAHVAVPERRPPSLRLPRDAVCSYLELEIFAREDRLDQLPEVAGDDGRPMRLGELVKARPQLEVLDQPVHDLAERGFDRFRVAADLLVQGDLAVPSQSRMTCIGKTLPAAWLADPLVRSGRPY